MHMKNYSTWLKTTAIFQFIAAAIHASSLFISLSPNNETEKQLFALMDTYKFDLGAGFHRTMGELTFVFSACLCLLCLFGGLLNWYLLRKKVNLEIMKGVILINLIVFGILFCLTVIFTFLLPIIQIGLIVLFLFFSIFTITRATNR
jgi:hypothetical protein